MNLQANQLLPLFNKGIRKFTRVFREVYEREIAKEVDAQRDGVQKMIQGGVKKGLREELEEGEVQLTKKMREEKMEFIKQFQKHQIKATDEEFEKALEGRQEPPKTISVAKRKRENDDDSEELETKVKKDKKDKKRFKKE